MTRLRFRDLLIAGAAAVLGIVAPLHADPPREINVPSVTDADQPYAVKLAAPGASTLAVSDVADALAVGFRYGNAAEVHIYKLDAAGAIVAGDPVKIPLPKPAALAANANATAALKFHPKLPLLYIWQDINTPGNVGDPATNPVFKELDHLLVVNLASGTPTVALTTCRGPEYAYNRGDGEFAFNADATRLYPPNIRMPQPAVDSNAPGLGWLTLDAAGMPVMENNKPKLGLEDASALGYPNSYGHVPVSDQIHIMPGSYGPVTLDLNNRRGRYTGPVYPGNAYWWYHTGHPTLQVVYTTYINTGTGFRIDHADGFLSGTYQRINFGGFALTGPPVVMAKAKKVAWPGGNRVMVVTIDDAGYFTPTVEGIPVKNPSVSGMNWSEKFGKLYIAVEAQ